MMQISYTDVVSAVLSHKDSDISIEFIRRKNESEVTDYKNFISQACVSGQQMVAHGIQPGDELVILSDDVAFLPVLLWQPCCFRSSRCL